MITNDDVFDRLKAANPQPDITDLVPTPSQFADFLHELEGTPVHTITKPPEPDKRTTPRGLLVAAAAFIVVIVLGGVWLVAGSEDVTPPTDTVATTTLATTTTTPPDAGTPPVSPEAQAVLDEFVRTYNEGDIAGHMALMSPGLTIIAGDRGGRSSPNGTGMGMTFPRDLASYERRIAWEKTVGTTVELSGCEGDGPVSCLATYHDFLSDPIFGGDTVRVELAIDQGVIVEYTETAVNGATFDGFLNGARVWIEKTYGRSLDHNDVVIEDPIEWSVYGRLYLESIKLPVPDMPFAPGVSPDEMRIVFESLRWIENGATSDISDIWPATTLRLYPTGDDIQYDVAHVGAWSTWLDAVGADLSIVSCEPVYIAEKECVVTVNDDLRAALSGDSDDWVMTWIFDVRDGVVVDLNVFDKRHDDYLEAVSAFAEWASQLAEPVTIELDPVTGDFVPTESNVLAYRTLIGEYLQTLGG